MELYYTTWPHLLLVVCRSETALDRQLIAQWELNRTLSAVGLHGISGNLCWPCLLSQAGHS